MARAERDEWGPASTSPRLCGGDLPWLAGTCAGLATHLHTTPAGAGHRATQRAVTVTVTPLAGVNGVDRATPDPPLYNVCPACRGARTGAGIAGSRNIPGR